LLFNANNNSWIDEIRSINREIDIQKINGSDTKMFIEEIKCSFIVFGREFENSEELFKILESRKIPFIACYRREMVHLAFFCQNNEKKVTKTTFKMSELMSAKDIDIEIENPRIKDHVLNMLLKCFEQSESLNYEKTEQTENVVSSALLGGFVAQEIIKKISGSEVTVNNCFFIDLMKLQSCCCKILY